MKLELLPPALLVLLSGCSSGSPSTTAGDGPTYYRDIKPLVDVKCAGCHVSGGIAPFTLGSYDEVKAQAVAMSSAVSARVMPPWPPDDACTPYVGDRSLQQDEIDTIARWAASGAPAGDPQATPVTVKNTQKTLSRVDRTLEMPVAYTPQLSPDEYRCFLVDWPETATTYVTGFGVKPGAPAIVHHVIAFLAPPSDVAMYQSLDDGEAGPGWTCFGGPGGSGQPQWLGGWAPGTLGSDFPAGTGIQVAPGSKIVIQVHYNTLTTKPEPDQTSVLVKTDPSVEKTAVVFPWTDPQWVSGKKMNIPAHTMDQSYSFGFDPTPYLGLVTSNVLAPNQPFTIHSAGLHMHTRGTHAVTRIQRGGGGDECMLDIPSWNFHWQGSYGFSQPKTVNAGDKLYLECHWNNTGDTDLNWGEGTEDEMCLGVFYATQ